MKRHQPPTPPVLPLNHLCAEIACAFAACRAYGERVRNALFWWGGALTPLQREVEDDSSSADEEPAAKVSVVLPGDAAAGADGTPEAKQQQS